MNDAGFWQKIARLGSRPGKLFAGATLALLLCSYTLTQSPAPESSVIDPLPPDTGVAGLKQMLRRLQTTARLLQITAHPDDEDGGMLTLESRGKGATVQLLSLTRGEGGQNKMGSNLFDVLGVLRTLELTASDRYYGVDQRFSRVADFGYSKTAGETFQKWQGHDIALDDIVRVIRTFHPDVLIARFSGTERDGHGHHQASAILTQEAFRAASDPKRFPEQIKEGLSPWQAKKLYIGNVCGFMSNACADENWTVKLNTGQIDPLLGMSYVQFAMEGLRHQLSQGAGGWKVDPGDRFTFYRLVDSAPPAADKNGHEQDFFDGIDTSLPGLATQIGQAVATEKMAAAAKQIAEAAQSAEKDPNSAVAPLFSALGLLGEVEASTRGHDLASPDVLTRVREKVEQVRAAINLALGISVTALVNTPAAPSTGGQELPAISPGQEFAVQVRVYNGSQYALKLDSIVVDGVTPAAVDDRAKMPPLPAGQNYEHTFRLQQPATDLTFTRPGLHRDDPERDSIYSVDVPAKWGALPFPPTPAFAVRVRYDVPEIRSPADGDPAVWTPVNFPEVAAPVLVSFASDDGSGGRRPLAVVPVFSIALEPGAQVVPVADGKETTVRVGVSSNLTGAPRGTLRLELPAGWKSEPARLPVDLPHRGDRQDLEFKVALASLKEGRAEIRAVLDAGGKQYTEGYSLVTRKDLDAFYYYQPALQRLSIVDVKVPKDLKVGYIMGAGDDIPAVLKQIGLEVNEIPAEKLATEDLGRYGTIVLGIRAYDTQKPIAANNKKLLDFVSAGGTLLVQYNTGVSDFNNGHFTPFPAQLSRARVSVEEAPVDILAPEDSVFHSPNQITQHDFEGWVQERGLYFMDNWDANFKPLLACHDPGEPPQKGGLLRAQYGKGTYIYTGYAFFRQLPDGVGGAVRLFVNLLSAGHQG
jgi:LmbE family N-acetylglucosaminyl deacetylase